MIGIQRMDASELLQVDWDHFKRLSLRRSILEKSSHQAIFATPSSAPAVKEMYEWLTQTYLPQRFPTIFERDADSGGMMRNRVNGEEFSIQSARDGGDALRSMAAMIDEDIMFLLPSGDDQGTYSLGAYAVCYVSGFDISRMQGKMLREIHDEVPGYKDKLQFSMDRFFHRMKPQEYVKRENVS